MDSRPYIKRALLRASAWFCRSASGHSANPLVNPMEMNTFYESASPGIGRDPPLVIWVCFRQCFYGRRKMSVWRRRDTTFQKILRPRATCNLYFFATFFSSFLSELSKMQNLPLRGKCGFCCVGGHVPCALNRSPQIVYTNVKHVGKSKASTWPNERSISKASAACLVFCRGPECILHSGII